MKLAFFNFRAVIGFLLACTTTFTWAANPTPLECPNSDKQTLSILAVGNSLTLHQPLPAIGWDGNWGMAASRIEKDYVSQFAAKLSQETSCKTLAERLNFATFERSFWLETSQASRKKILASAKGANIIIMQLSDNVSDSDFTTYQFEQHYAELIREVMANAPTSTLICMGPWWSHAGKEEAISRSCRSAAGIPVSISDLRANVDNRATTRSQNPGVAAHPSDAGMAAIATRIVEALRAAKKIH